jgi:chromate reductase, NAD(P)H dehydrogenase (quinone)
MKKIVAFGGSNSKNSINKQLAEYAANRLENVEVNILDLNEFELPVYSIDMERASGIPKKGIDFKSQIDQADGVVLSLAEHNGSFSASYKNIYDWVSRIDKQVYQNKPLLLMATSPGGRGGKTVLNHALSVYGFSHKAALVSFSLPSFHQNFNPDQGIKDLSLKEEFEQQLEEFSKALRKEPSKLSTGITPK